MASTKVDASAKPDSVKSVTMSNFTSTEVAVEVLVVVNNSRGSSELPSSSPSESASNRRLEDSVTFPSRRFLILLTDMLSIFAMEVASAWGLYSIRS